MLINVTLDGGKICNRYLPGFCKSVSIPFLFMICCICSSRYSRFFIKEFDSFSRKLRNNTDTLGILALLTGLPRQPSVIYALTMYLHGTVLLRGGGGATEAEREAKNFRKDSTIHGFNVESSPHSDDHF